MQADRFGYKLAGTIAAVALYEVLAAAPGMPIGLWLLALVPLTWATRRAVRRDRRAWPWLVLAMGMAGVMIWHPTAPGWALFWACAGIAALMPGVALETVLITLIDNARAAGATEVTIHTTIERAMAIIAITDNGGGIAPGDRQRIFEPFFTSHRQTGGTGLGLPIARALITGQRGSLTLDGASAATCFVIRVPLAASEHVVQPG